MRSDSSVFGSGVFSGYRSFDFVRRFALDAVLMSSRARWLAAVLFAGVSIVSVFVVVPVDILVFLCAMAASVSLFVIVPLATISIIVGLLESIE